MEKKYILWTLLVVILAGITVVSAIPWNFGVGQQLQPEERKRIEEERQAIKVAIENNDYETWKNLMEQKIERMRSHINQENFQRISEAYKSRLENRKNNSKLINKDAWIVHL